MPQLPRGQRALSRAPDGISRVRSMLLSTLSIEIGVLIVTGIALFFLYRPTARETWGDLVTESYDWNVRVAYGLRLVHRLASGLTVPTAIATGVAVAVGGRGSARRWTGALLGAGIAIATLAASFTGFLLPWDQLALWAVTVGSNVQGYRVLFEPAVRFVLLGGVEIRPDTVIRWLLMHVLVLGPALVVSSCSGGVDTEPASQSAVSRCRFDPAAGGV
jgi:quinol-cytochrome oxidoreductase complex cytochrome b subunit